MSKLDCPRILEFVAVVVSVWLLTGALKVVGRLSCDIARKVNHALALAGGAIWFGWLPAASAEASGYAACGLLLVLVGLTCVFRDRTPFRLAFLANTRKSDSPHEGLYFWSSWFVSMAGLAGVQFVFGDIVITRTAALLVGIGDGIAEPVGRRWGRHRFQVLSLTRGKLATRSAEGCVAVFASCFLTLLGCFGPMSAPAAATIALVVTLVEAVSPHGLDNLTIPVASAVVLHHFRTV
jgi:dolichol kinase